MKKGMIWILAISILMFIGADWNNLIERSSSDAISLVDTLKSTDKNIIYVLFPTTSGDWYLSKTLPTKATGSWGKRRAVTGDFYWVIQTDTIAGLADSLNYYKKTLIYDPIDGEFAIIEDDSTFLVFDVPETYTASSANSITVVHGKEFGCNLSGLLDPTVGFALYANQDDVDLDTTIVKHFYYTGR